MSLFRYFNNRSFNNIEMHSEINLMLTNMAYILLIIVSVTLGGCKEAELITE